VYSDSITGEFIRLLDEWKYDLLITSDGYQEKRIEWIRVNNYQTTNIPIQLVPIGYGITEELFDEQQMLNLYPDPVSGMLSVEINPPNPGLYTIEIISIDGKIIRYINNISVLYEGIVVKTDVNELSGGIYFVRLRNNNNVWVKKFIKSE